MKAKERLCGRGSFDKVFASGRRLDANLIRCFCAARQSTTVSVRVGFSTPVNLGGAVKRNRIRRLMREAYARERPALIPQLVRQGRSAEIVFLFKRNRTVDSNRVTLHHIHTDIALLCTLIARQAGTEAR